MEWKEYKLSQLLIIKNGKDYKSLPNGDIPVFGSGGYMCSVGSCLYEGESILLPRKGTLANIQYYSGAFWTVDTCFYSTINKKLAIPYYLYLYLKKLDLSGLDTGASIPSMTIGTYYALCVKLPSLDYQSKIADIIKNYDTLIDINTKRIKLLEESARELYKEWFVRMRFPGYEKTKFVKGIPDGWTYTKVTDLLEIKYGKDHKALEEGDYPCYGSGGIMRYVDKCLFEGESVLIPRKGSLNNIMIVNSSFWTIDTMFYTIPKMKNVAKYAYYMLLSIDMESLNAGAALPSMTTNILSNMDILLPSQDILKQLESYLSPIFHDIEILTKENQNLATTRDRLLPRLLSGELKVKA